VSTKYVCYGEHPLPNARKTLVSLDATLCCCICGCIRRVSPCGEDHYGGRIEHRRQWIEDRLLALTSIHAIDIAAYSVISNHYHVVLQVDRQQGLTWNDAEVIEGWNCLFKSSLLSRRFSRGERLDRPEQQALVEQLANWRPRLIPYMFLNASA
jgi:hypothetical protein